MKLLAFFKRFFLVLLLCFIAWTPARMAASSIQPLRNADVPLNTRKLVYATYLGGALADAIIDLDEDARGNVYVTGITNSKDLPTTNSAFQRNPRGGQDGFAAKIGPNGRLIYLTYRRLDVPTAEMILRACAKIIWHFAAGPQARWRGASDEHTHCGMVGASNEASGPVGRSPTGRGGAGPPRRTIPA